MILEGEESCRTGAVDNAISNILVDLRPHNYEAWKWRFEDTFGVELDVVLKVSWNCTQDMSVMCLTFSAKHSCFMWDCLFLKIHLQSNWLSTSHRVLIKFYVLQSVFHLKQPVKMYFVLSVCVPGWTVCSHHSGHHMHWAVDKGVLVLAVWQTVWCVLLRQYYLELVLHVQGKEKQSCCSCFAVKFFFLS